MVFSSFLFLWIFFPIVIAGYYLSPSKIRNVWLLVVSLLFYAWGEPKYIFLMIFSILFNYLIGMIIAQTEGTAKKVYLIVGIVFNVGILFIFKYVPYICELFSGVLGCVSNETIVNFSLPIGISFYTFQSMSYLIDLYRGKYKAQRNLISLALYISFFPQLIAGPIVRYVDIEKKINSRAFNTKQFIDGIERFSYGLGKKVIIANGIGGVVQNIDSIGIGEITGLMAWIGSVCYTFQIYYDFSGYSDMAIGLGKMFGFDFKENFNLPYLSKSISEFWRRWHISLGNWFREYVYIPLGGNRGGEIRTYLNLLIVFMLTGIWHGANVTFLLWGIYYGVLIVAERIFLKNSGKSIFGLVYTLFLVNCGWVFFRNDSLLYSVQWIERMLLPWKYVTSDYNTLELISNLQAFQIIMAIIFAGPIQKVNSVLVDRIKIPILLKRFCQFVIVSISLIMLSGNAYNPFIYFRF